jgi:glycosyltransferase involved in cell wall biosynthesis
MMTDRGHTVFLYASQENEARVEQLFTCVKKKHQIYPEPVWDANHPMFANFNNRAIAQMATVIEDDDIICIIGGNTQKPVSDAFPNHLSVEFGIGYAGVYADYKVFESYAWMHTVYGESAGAYAANGSFFDTVIPNYFEPEDFPEHTGSEDPYILYIGRLIDRKGIHLAADVCKRAGARLVVAGGSGTPPEYGEYVGMVGVEERGRLMSGASAVIVPTLYLEPFGGVHVEAQLCGTPVLTTDWGVFTETVTNGFNGFRCKSPDEFIEKIGEVDKLDNVAIRKYAQDRWSTDTVAKMYEDYFERIIGFKNA